MRPVPKYRNEQGPLARILSVPATLRSFVLPDSDAGIDVDRHGCSVQAVRQKIARRAFQYVIQYVSRTSVVAPIPYRLAAGGCDAQCDTKLESLPRCSPAGTAGPRLEEFGEDGYGHYVSLAIPPFDKVPVRTQPQIERAEHERR